MTAGSWRAQWDDVAEHVWSARAAISAALGAAVESSATDALDAEDAADILRHLDAAAELVDTVMARHRPARAGGPAAGETLSASVDDRPRLSVRREATGGAEGLVALRAWVRDTLDGWRVDRTSAGAAIDVAHELASNALQHAAPPVCVELELREGAVDVIVHDGDATRAVLRPYRAGVSDSGLGLHLVKQLASAWGQRAEPTGKRVWARIAREQRQGGAAKRARGGSVTGAIPGTRPGGAPGTPTGSTTMPTRPRRLR
jgi:anti-sigma regulatory factor (Ser/Thr protein kinase)